MQGHLAAKYDDGPARSRRRVDGRTCPRSAGKVAGFSFTGTLQDADYRTFVPLVDAVAEEHGSVRLLVQLEDFDGWEPHAASDDFEFGLRHRKTIERMAIVGEGRLVNWMTRLSRPFTDAQVRQFAPTELESAWTWLEEAS